MRRRDFSVGEIRLRADELGPDDAQPVLFLHGSGQTRHAWRRAVIAVAERGYRGVSLDLRGHGDSGWSPDRRYSLDRFVDDIAQVCADIGQRPVLVGASLGGMIGMGLLGRPQPPINGLVLVDIVPRVPDDGSEHVRDFMDAAPHGFASLEEAAEAVSRYLPHRARPRDSGGLAKNLRRKEDGRFYWHWDPNLMVQFEGRENQDAVAERHFALLDATDIPLMLIRGGLSRIVTQEGAEEFTRRVPAAEVVQVDAADHMVAGDSNRLFNQSVLDFLDRHDEWKTTQRPK